MSENSALFSEQRKAKYRDLLDVAESLQENEETGSETVSVIKGILTQVDTLFKDRNDTEMFKAIDEIVLDSKVVALTSNILYSVTEAIDCEIYTYDPKEFAQKLCMKFALADETEEELNWSSLQETINSVLNFPPNLQYLFGPVGSTLDESKVVITRKKRAKQSQEDNAKQQQLKQPEKITTMEKEKDSVDDTVRFLQWALNKEFEENGEKPLEYLKFLIDPNSFSKTIENMFHFSFLVRDGRVKIFYDDDGLLVLSPVSRSVSQRARNSGVEDKQCIVSIDMEDWKAAVDAFEIRSCFLDKWRDKWENRKSK